MEKENSNKIPKEDTPNSIIAENEKVGDVDKNNAEKDAEDSTEIGIKEFGSELLDMIAIHKGSINIHTMSRLNMIPDGREKIGVIELFFDMIRDSRKNEYKLVSASTFITLLGSVLYVISPLDIIPDRLGIVGLLDDFAVIAFAVRTIYEELCAYKLWLVTRDLPVNEAYKLIKKTMAEYKDFID